PLRDLLPRHLEAEERARRLQVDGDVVCDLEGECALTHRRASGENHEVRRLEAGGDSVEVLETTGEGRPRGAGFVEMADPLERLDERVLEEDEFAVRTALGELEDELLGSRDELGGLAFAVPAELGDLAPGKDQAAQRRGLLHDLRVVARV